MTRSVVFRAPNWLGDLVMATVLLEALACGTPAVGTPIGATPEILERLAPQEVGEPVDDDPLVLEAFRAGDAALFAARPALDGAPVVVHFHSNDRRYRRTEQWGTPADYRV